MWKRALIAAVPVLLAILALMGRPAQSDVISCGANMSLFYSPPVCGGTVGPTVTVLTPATQAPSVAFDIAGHYYNSSAPTGIKFCTSTSTGCTPVTALTAPTIGGNAWASTAADVTIASAGTYYVCVGEVPSTSVTGCSSAFTVGAACPNALDFSAACDSQYIAAAF